MTELPLKGKVLLVEDCRDVRLVVTRLLEVLGLEVVAVESAEAALTSMASNPFDLALVDLGLPTLDGFEFVEVARQEGYFLPCLALSGDPSPEHREKWVRCGGQGFIAKPVARRHLRLELLRWLLHGTEVFADSRGALDAQFVKAMKSSIEELSGALDRSDRERAGDIAHRIKGTSGAFGAAEVATASSAVESALKGADEDSLSLSVGQLFKAIEDLHFDRGAKRKTHIVKGRFAD